jgi:hypothetical protein
MLKKLFAVLILSALSVAAQSSPRRKPLYPKPTITKRPANKVSKHNVPKHKQPPRAGHR